MKDEVCLSLKVAGLYMSFCLNSLKGGYMEDYIGVYYRGY